MTTDTYFAKSRPEMLAFMPALPGRVLDVGCGQGGFGALLKAHAKAVEVWGVEPVAQAHAQARRVLDKALCGSFDAGLDLPARSFDAVVFNDSLEHLADTAAALALARRLLAPGGCVLASIPNVRFWPHLREVLFRADWRYRDEGILDRTHLRFFTRRSMLRSFAEAGFDVQRIEGITPCWHGLRLALARALLPRGMQDMLYLQFAVVATPAPGKDPAACERA